MVQPFDNGTPILKAKEGYASLVSYASKKIYDFCIVMGNDHIYIRSCCLRHDDAVMKTFYTNISLNLTS